MFFLLIFLDEKYWVVVFSEFRDESKIRGYMCFKIFFVLDILETKSFYRI